MRRGVGVEPAGTTSVASACSGSSAGRLVAEAVALHAPRGCLGRLLVGGVGYAWRRRPTRCVNANRAVHEPDATWRTRLLIDARRIRTGSEHTLS